MDEGMYKAMYLTGCVPPKFYGLPKIHKTGNLFRPIVSSRGPVTYGVAKIINKVLKPLIGKSNPPHTKYRRLCIKGQRSNSPTRRVPHFL